MVSEETLRRGGTSSQACGVVGRRIRGGGGDGGFVGRKLKLKSSSSDGLDQWFAAWFRNSQSNAPRLEALNTLLRGLKGVINSILRGFPFYISNLLRALSPFQFHVAHCLLRSTFTCFTMMQPQDALLGDVTARKHPPALETGYS